MTTSPRGIALITRFEGLALKPYKCPAGYWTIGYGQQDQRRTGRGVEKRDQHRRGHGPVSGNAGSVRGVCGKHGHGSGPAKRVRCPGVVLLQRGPGNVRKSGVIDLVNDGKPCMGAVRLSTSCVRGGGKLLRGLVNRRYREASMMAEGSPDALETIRQNLVKFYSENWPTKSIPK